LLAADVSEDLMGRIEGLKRRRNAGPPKGN